MDSEVEGRVDPRMKQGWTKGELGGWTQGGRKETGDRR